MGVCLGERENQSLLSGERRLNLRVREVVGYRRKSRCVGSRTLRLAHKFRRVGAKSCDDARDRPAKWRDDPLIRFRLVLSRLRSLSRLITDVVFTTAHAGEATPLLFFHIFSPPTQQRFSFVALSHPDLRLKSYSRRAGCPWYVGLTNEIIAIIANSWHSNSMNFWHRSDRAQRRTNLHN